MGAGGQQNQTAANAKNFETPCAWWSVWSERASTARFLAREITLTAGGKETEQWVQRQPQKGVRIQNLRPNAGDVLLDDYKNQWVYSAQTKQWARHESLLPKLHGRIQDVLERIKRGDLTAELMGQDKVAGRTTDIVRVGPPVGVSAPSRKFWIDKKTGLRLKMEEIGADGRVIASSYYVSVDPSPKFGPDDFAAPPQAASPSGGRHGAKPPAHGTVSPAHLQNL